MSILNRLIGKKIIKVALNDNVIVPLDKNNKIVTESPMSLIIEDYTLNIYNPLIIKGSQEERSLQVLVNLTLKEAIETEEAITLKLDNSIELVIDMRDESFRGPEALTLYGPDNLIVVWN